MKNIFKILKDSTYNPLFYSTITSTPSKQVFRDYFKVTTLLSVFMTLAFGVLLVPQGISFLKESAPLLVKQYYPPELVIRLDKGEASTDVPMPYFVSIKDATPAKNRLIENMLVVDTVGPFDKKKFNEYKTYVLLTKTDIVTEDDMGNITMKSLSTLPSGVVSQDALLSWVDKILGASIYIVPIALILVFILFSLGYAIYLIPLLFFALITFLISWVKKSPTLTYRNAYKISMYAIIPGLVLKSILNLFGFLFVPPYLTLFVFLLIISLNMREEPKPVASL